MVDAQVESWDPGDQEDWAVLKLSCPAPVQCKMARLSSNSTPAYGACNFWIYGFPDIEFESDDKFGIWVQTAYEGVNEAHLWQIQALRSDGVQVQEGFSGCPVWDDANQLIGIVLMAGEDYGLGFILPARKILLSPSFGIYLQSSSTTPTSEKIPASKPRRPTMQTRTNWLKGHGLIMDPFTPDADRAEDDPLIKLPEFSFAGYVQPGKFDQVFSNTYITMYSGGGRTALCKWIKNQSQRGNLNKPGHSTYVIHYSFQRTSNLSNHMQAISRIMKTELGGIELDNPSSVQSIIESLGQMGKQFGYTDIRILVDPGSSGRWDEWATDDDLLNAPGIRFHFFLEKSSFDELRDQLPLNRYQILEIPLTSELADLALRYRCLACLDPYINSNAFSLESLFEPRIRTQVLETFIKIGVQKKSFREMWRFGNELFNKHLNEDGLAVDKSLITASIFRATRERFIR